MTRCWGWSFLAAAALGSVSAAHADEPKGTEVKLGKLASKAPETWKHVKTEKPFRHAEFTLPRVGTDSIDAVVIVYHFGEDAGGGVDDNVKRWKAMFKPPEGKKIDDVFKKDEFKVGGAKVIYVELHGTFLYKETPMSAEVEPRAEHRMISVIVQCEKGPYFIRFVGPEKTVAEYRKGFDAWLKNFK